MTQSGGKRHPQSRHETQCNELFDRMTSEELERYAQGRFPRGLLYVAGWRWR